MLHISLKNASGWGLLMKQHSYFPPEKDKHSHKGGMFAKKKIFSVYQFIATAHVGEYSTFSLHEQKCLFGHVNILQLQI